MNDLIALLRSHRLRYGNEKQLQDDIERLLLLHGLQFTREAALKSGKIDFLMADGVGIECKVSGGPSEILSQLIRYADEPTLTALILVTSRRSHRRPERELRGKPFSVVWVAANAL